MRITNPINLKLGSAITDDAHYGVETIDTQDALIRWRENWQQDIADHCAPYRYLAFDSIKELYSELAMSWPDGSAEQYLCVTSAR